ncbi:MAG: hypothetical protein HN368_15975, partial [Spirochaetales bacterium]|nr:hypothetical protein [Spirochaetales bacterium]
ASATAGISYPLADNSTTTSLCYSMLLPTLSDIGYWQHELIAANQMYISDEVKLFLDAGIRYTKSYELIYEQPVVQLVWKTGMRVSTRGK